MAPRSAVTIVVPFAPRSPPRSAVGAIRFCGARPAAPGRPDAAPGRPAARRRPGHLVQLMTFLIIASLRGYVLVASPKPFFLLFWNESRVASWRGRCGGAAGRSRSPQDTITSDDAFFRQVMCVILRKKPFKRPDVASGRLKINLRGSKISSATHPPGLISEEMRVCFTA